MKKWMLGLMAAAVLTASTGIGTVSAVSWSGGMTIRSVNARDSWSKLDISDSGVAKVSAVAYGKV